MNKSKQLLSLCESLGDKFASFDDYVSEVRNMNGEDEMPTWYDHLSKMKDHFGSHKILVTDSENRSDLRKLEREFVESEVLYEIKGMGRGVLGTINKFPAFYSSEMGFEEILHVQPVSLLR